MGYNTTYKINYSVNEKIYDTYHDKWIMIGDLYEDIENDLKNNKECQSALEGCYSGWPYNDFMMKLTNSYPHVVFEVIIIGEDLGDISKHSYLNGKSSFDRATVNFPTPNYR